MTNYTQLQAQIANYLGRTDLTSQIPLFITFAETRLSREIRTRKLLKSAYATIPGGDSKISIPPDFLEMRDIYLDGNPRVSLNYLSPSAFTRDAITTPGKPTYYTVLGQEFEFAPTPDGDYNVELLYFYKPTALSNTVASNAYLVNYPDALLYASLSEAEPYLMNDQRIQVWASLYDRAIANIKLSDQNSEYAGVPIAMKVTTR